MKIILDGGKPRYETEDGQPLPVGVAGFTVDYMAGEGVQAALVLDMVKVRAMLKPRVCVSLNGALERIQSITLEGGRTLSSDDLLKALDDRAR